MNPLNKAVLFDMDGVVLDTEPLYTKAEIRLFGEYGVLIPEEVWSLFCFYIYLARSEYFQGTIADYAAYFRTRSC